MLTLQKIGALLNEYEHDFTSNLVTIIAIGPWTKTMIPLSIAKNIPISVLSSSSQRQHGSVETIVGSKHIVNTSLLSACIIIIVMVMKRIEAFVASERTPYVLSALEGLGLQATFYESKGMGKGEKYTVSYSKGSGTQKMAYSTRSIVVSIVDENKVKEAVSVIKEAAKTGTTSAGIVVVSSVDDLMMIGI